MEFPLCTFVSFVVSYFLVYVTDDLDFHLWVRYG